MMVSRLLSLSFLVTASVIAGCTSSSSDDTPAPTSTASIRILGVHPPTTDPAIPIIYSAADDSHMVRFNPQVPLVGRLFVFFPGSGARARDYRYIVAEAANNGYHAIGLTYVNDQAIGVLCASTPNDLDCHGKCRSEILTGTDSTTLRTVSRASSVENRLLKLLQYLHTQFPADGWNQYYTGNALVWNKLSVSGHSQGAGFSGYVGKVRSVFRVGMYSSGGDFSTTGVPSNWMRRPGLTPASSYYGFSSKNDELAAWEGATGVNALWTELGMGAIADTLRVDAVSSYGTTRKLFTTATPRNPAVVVGPNHNVPVVDVNTPLDASGRPVFRSVWRYVSLPQ